MSKVTPAAGGAGVGPSRRTWNAEEYAQRARERDRKERERAEENEERARKGEKPLKRKKEELPKPTQELRQREQDLELTKNQGKTLMVENVGAGGQKGPGFYCETCHRTFKDSIAYLDHVNGRLHLRKLGQTTQVARSTLEQVRERLVFWQAELRNRSKQSQEYDFERRLAEIAEQQKHEKQERRRKRKEMQSSNQSQAPPTDAEAMAMMGFGAFGSSKK